MWNSRSEFFFARFWKIMILVFLELISNIQKVLKEYNLFRQFCKPTLDHFQNHNQAISVFIKKNLTWHRLGEWWDLQDKRYFEKHMVESHYCILEKKSNQIAFPCLAYFSEIVAIYGMISTDRQHQLVYSISSLKQVRFITTEQDLSLATRFMLSSLEPIKCMPFSQESVPKLETVFLIRLK